MIQRDLPRVLEIERESYKNGWDKDQFKNALRRQHTTGIVCELVDLGVHSIVGYMVHEMNESCIDILGMAVDKGFQRCGVGTFMVNHLRGRMKKKRPALHCAVNTDDIEFQAFFNALGFWIIESAKHDNAGWFHLYEWHMDEGVRAIVSVLHGQGRVVS